MIRVRHKGNLAKTTLFLKRLSKFDLQKLAKYGEEGVRALSEATPKDTGYTAASWYYEIVRTNTGIAINWSNRNVVKYANVALLLQYGHATRGGGYVVGIDYINPAMRPIFDKIAKKAWEEVTGR